MVKIDTTRLRSPVLKASMRKSSGSASTVLYTHSTVTERGSEPPSTPADEKITQTRECMIAEPKPVAPCQAEVEIRLGLGNDGLVCGSRTFIVGGRETTILDPVHLNAPPALSSMHASDGIHLQSLPLGRECSLVGSIWKGLMSGAGNR